MNQVWDKNSQSSSHSLSKLDIYHPEHIYQLINSIVQKTDIKNVIHISTKKSNIADHLNDEVNLIEIDLAAEVSSYKAFERQTDVSKTSNTLLSQKLLIDESTLEQSIVFCSDVIERLSNPTWLIDILARWADLSKYILIAIPDRDRVENHEKQAHLMKWNLPELCSLLSKHNFPIGFYGHTISESTDNIKTTSLIISGQEAVYSRQQLVPVTAIINCYNEADIIKDVVLYLVKQEINVVIYDNWSTDGSYEIVQQLAEQLPHIKLNRFPDTPTPYFYLNEQLINTVDVSEQLGHGWYLHYDADEIRESPWQEVNLREAISFVDSLGYNAIDFSILNFRYLKDNQEYTSDLFSQRLRHFNFGEHPADFKQIKGWKYYGQTVNLKDNGGHHAKFADQKIYPFKFLTRHYPLRSPEQAHQKIFKDRLPRFRAERQKMNRHVHYDYLTKKQLAGWDKKSLISWDSELFYPKYLVERISGIGLSPSKSESENSATYIEALEAEPDNPRLHFMLAKTQAEAGNIDQAIVSARRAWELDPECVDYAEQLSNLLIEVNKLSEAFSLVKNLLKCQPENPRIYKILASLQRQQQDVEGEIATYQKLVELVPNNDNFCINLGNKLIQLDRNTEAVEKLKKSLEVFPQQPNLYFVLGRAYFKQQDFDLAIASYLKALELNYSKPAAVYNHLAGSFNCLGHRQQALKAFKQAIELEPSNVNAHIAMGNFYRQGQEWDLAIRSYQNAINLNCQNIGVYFALGQVLRSQERIEEAIVAYQHCLGLNPDHSQTYVGLGNCYRQQKDSEKAIAFYQKATNLNCQNTGVYFALGQLLRTQGKIEEAIVAYQNCLELQPDHFHSYAGVGHCYLEQQRPEQAIANFRKSLEINSRNANLWFILGQTLRQQGQKEEAVSCYQKAISSNHPNIFGVYKAMGETLKEKNQIKQAIAAFEQALEIKPHNSVIKQSLDQLMANK